MKKCKICGEIFAFEVTSKHLEEKHNITRKQYKEIKINDTIFSYGRINSEEDSEINNYVIGSIRKSIKTRNDKTLGRKRGY